MRKPGLGAPASVLRGEVGCGPTTGRGGSPPPSTNLVHHGIEWRRPPRKLRKEKARIPQLSQARGPSVDSSGFRSAAKSGFGPREGAVERTAQIRGLAQWLDRLVEGILPVREPAERAL